MDTRVREKEKQHIHTWAKIVKKNKPSSAITGLNASSNNIDSCQPAQSMLANLVSNFLLQVSIFCMSKNQSNSLPYNPDF